MEPLLSIEDLKVHYPVSKGFFSKKKRYVYALDGVSLTLEKGETLGIVGESGCGKTTAAMAVMGLSPITAGTVRFEGKDVSRMNGREMFALRKEMQIIFQDPFSSLNPRMTLYKTLYDPMTIHHLHTPAQRRERVAYLLEKVGLRPEHGNRYPHQFSGGQRQRIGIARALALNPQVIIGDEPVSALDVSIQAQIINLLLDLQHEFHLSYIIISHDLAVVEHISDRIIVMYLGKVVETADYKSLYNDPRHPYTQSLLSAIPIPDPRARSNRILLDGDVPSPRRPPDGCRFHPRCPHKMEICEQNEPPLKDLGQGHFAACFLV